MAVAILIVLGLSGLRVAQEYQRGVVFRLGRYVGRRGPGLFWIIPLSIERAITTDVRTRTVSAEQQETITHDSVTIKVNAVLWYRIVDAAKSVIEVMNAPAAVCQLALTGLRNIIGQHDLDEVLQERKKDQQSSTREHREFDEYDGVDDSIGFCVAFPHIGQVPAAGQPRWRRSRILGNPGLLKDGMSE